MRYNAIIIGNSSGIGLSVTERLLNQGWHVTGISRSESKIKNPDYRHILANVSESGYSDTLTSALQKMQSINLCIYCAGIGELLNIDRMYQDIEIFNVNLFGLVQTVVVIIPVMQKQNKGHFIGLSSVADDMLSPEAPSYHASKAGFSNYLESLGLALKNSPVSITNIRFGFVDTKMAKGDVRPFMMSVDTAANHVMHCIVKKPIRYTVPKVIIPLIKFRKWMLNLQV